MGIRQFQPGEAIAAGYRFVVVMDGSVEGVSNGQPVNLPRGGWYEEDAIMEGAGEMDATAAQKELNKRRGTLQGVKAGAGGAKLGILTKEGIQQVFAILGLSESGSDGVVDYTRKMNLAKKVHIFRQLTNEQLD